MNTENFNNLLESSWIEIKSILNNLSQDTIDWISTNNTELIGALIVLFITYLFSLIIAAIVRKSFSRRKDSETLSAFLALFAKIVIIVIGVVFVTQLLSLDDGARSILAGLGIITFALGFAIQDLVKDLLAGLFIIIKRPFRDGDLIRGDGYFGQVIKTDMRSTRLKTIDGQIVTIPNKNLFINTVENFTLSRIRKINLTITIDAVNDVAAIKKAVSTAINENDLLHQDKKPQLSIVGATSAQITIEVGIWLSKTAETIYRDTIDQIILSIQRKLIEVRITGDYEVVLKSSENKDKK